MEQVFINGNNINTMNVSTLLKELQKTDKYTGMTQKQIIDQLDVLLKNIDSIGNKFNYVDIKFDSVK